MRKRIIVHPDKPAEVSEQYAALVIAAINEQRWIARSVVFDGEPLRPQIIVDLRVHAFPCLESRKDRYAVVADGPETIIVDFPAKRHALRYYRDLVRDMEQDPGSREGGRIHAWDVTDVPGLPTNKGAVVG